MMLPFVHILAVLITSAVAKTVVINVGQSGLSFSPDSSTADVGDVLEFHFFSSIHSAVSGDFSSPCQMSSSGFDSGPINNKADGSGSVFQVTVQDTNPIWFFCGTPGHCQSGMAGVINPPSSGDSLASYKSSAAGTSTSASGTVQGGVVAPVPNGSSSSSSPPSSSAATSSSTSATSAPSSSSSIVSGKSSGTTSITSLSSAPASSSASSQATSTAQRSTSATSGPTSAVSTAVGSSSSGTSTSLASPPPVTTSGGAISLGKFGLGDLLVVGLALLVGFM